MVTLVTESGYTFTNKFPFKIKIKDHTIFDSGYELDHIMILPVAVGSWSILALMYYQNLTRLSNHYLIVIDVLSGKIQHLSDAYQNFVNSEVYAINGDLVYLRNERLGNYVVDLRSKTLTPYNPELIYPFGLFKILDVNRYGNILYHEAYNRDLKFNPEDSIVMINKGYSDRQLIPNKGTFRWAFDGTLILHFFNGVLSFYTVFGQKLNFDLKVPKKCIIDIFLDRVMIHDISHHTFDALKITYSDKIYVDNVKAQIQYPENHLRRLIHFDYLDQYSGKILEDYKNTIFGRQYDLNRLLTKFGIPISIFRDLVTIRTLHQNITERANRDVISNFLIKVWGYSEKYSYLIYDYITSPVFEDEKGTYRKTGRFKIRDRDDFLIYMLQ